MCSSWPEDLLGPEPSGPEPNGPEVIRPVGWSWGVKGPEDFLEIGPELGPDRTDPLLCWEEEEGREPESLEGGGPLDGRCGG